MSENSLLKVQPSDASEVRFAHIQPDYAWTRTNNKFVGPMELTHILLTMISTAPELAKFRSERIKELIVWFKHNYNEFEDHCEGLIRAIAGLSMFMLWGKEAKFHIDRVWSMPVFGTVVRKTYFPKHHNTDQFYAESLLRLFPVLRPEIRKCISLIAEKSNNSAALTIYAGLGFSKILSEPTFQLIQFIPNVNSAAFLSQEICAGLTFKAEDNFPPVEAVRAIANVLVDLGVVNVTPHESVAYYDKLSAVDVPPNSNIIRWSELAKIIRKFVVPIVVADRDLQAREK